MRFDKAVSEISRDRDRNKTPSDPRYIVYLPIYIFTSVIGS